MKTTEKIKAGLVLILIAAFSMSTLSASDLFFGKKQKQSDETFKTFQGKIIDAESSQPLIFAAVAIEGTNIATVSNTEGSFSIKVPNQYLSAKIKISYIGYENLSLPVSDLKEGKNNVLKLQMISVNLTEVKVFPNNPRLLIEKVLAMRNKNYASDPVIMTAFYRETIKKRWNYIALSEAVVEVYKQAYNNERQDLVKLYKGRKSTDVEKMDTLLFKLQGGPYSTLMLDVVKDPYLVLSNDVLEHYTYTYINITRIDGRLNYVIEFKQRPYVSTPLFYGRFYIDVDNFAITSASFSLNTENEQEASAMFIKRKPLGVNVVPTSATYLVNYTEKDGKWYYSYSRGEVSFKVNWKKRLFSNTFNTMVEMAVTDWKPADEKPFRASDRMRMNVVMTETVNGFADADFWGEYNTIEPEQSIESAIKKIKKNLEKTK
ncbi:MAG: carboxypeptidase-like regulatory domain-containing protein [Salinivirgaceae bacterium]|jgi:hypothetical protein